MNIALQPPIKWKRGEREKIKKHHQHFQTSNSKFLAMPLNAIYAYFARVYVFTSATINVFTSATINVILVYFIVTLGYVLYKRYIDFFLYHYHAITLDSDPISWSCFQYRPHSNDYSSIYFNSNPNTADKPQNYRQYHPHAGL